MPIEAYVIVSANGMLADSTGVMPDSLKFPADHAFFDEALDRAHLLVHGRHSHEGHRNSAGRRRVILTSQIEALGVDKTLPNATLWNPAGATFEEACAAAGVSPAAKIAIIGGPAVYNMFLDRYDAFWLSQAHDVHLENGLAVLSGVPTSTPQAILARHGLQVAETRLLDAANNVDLTVWRK